MEQLVYKIESDKKDSISLENDIRRIFSRNGRIIAAY